METCMVKFLSAAGSRPSLVSVLGEALGESTHRQILECKRASTRSLSADCSMVLDSEAAQSALEETERRVSPEIC